MHVAFLQIAIEVASRSHLGRPGARCLPRPSLQLGFAKLRNTEVLLSNLKVNPTARECRIAKQNSGLPSNPVETQNAIPEHDRCPSSISRSCNFKLWVRCGVLLWLPKTREYVSCELSGEYGCSHIAGSGVLHALTGPMFLACREE